MVIGLTGGIASGKSTISSILKDLGAYVIDVDLIGREVVQKGEKAYNEIVQYFGSSILLPDGEINRKKLGNIVFSNSIELGALNNMTHPRIVERVALKINTLKNKGEKAIVIDAAILFEMGLNKFCDIIWFIYADKDTQLNRLIKRNKFSYEEALNRIESQNNNQESLKLADIVINNNKTLAIIKEEVKKLWFETIYGKDEHNCLK